MLSQNLPLNKLQALKPLDSLSRAHLEQIAGAARTEKISPSNRLVARDERRWLIYLLDGRLTIRESDGASHTLDSNSETARHPLFDPMKTVVQAKALQPSSVVRIDRNMLQILVQQSESSATVVQEVDINETDDALFTRVYQAYVDKKLKLPSLPDVAMRIREVIKNPDLGIADVARIVQTDPVLTARLVQVANSPIYQGVNPVDSALAAVNRLGGSTTQNLAFVLAVSSLFKSDSAVIQARMTQLYDYSAELGALCFVIADRCENLDRERAMLIGLISHIGAIPILAYAAEDSTIALNKSVIDNALRNLCCITTGLVLTQWGFDPNAIHICENCEPTNTATNDNQISYRDVLVAAELIAESRFLVGGPSADCYDMHPIQQKFERQGIMEKQQVLLEEVKQELELTRLLLMSC